MTTASFWSHGGDIATLTDFGKWNTDVNALDKNSTLDKVLKNLQADNYDNNASRQILLETGLQLDRVRDYLQELAQSDLKKYQKIKSDWKKGIEAEVYKSYATTKAEYESVGFPPHISMQRAKEASIKVAEIRNEVFNSVFRNQGMPIQDTY
jgi:hypothetical protein